MKPTPPQLSGLPITYVVVAMNTADPDVYVPPTAVSQFPSAAPDDKANLTVDNPAGASVDVPTNAAIPGFIVALAPGTDTVVVGTNTSNVNPAELSAT